MIANNKEELEQAFPAGTTVNSVLHGIGVVESYGDFGAPGLAGHGRYYLLVRMKERSETSGIWPRYCHIKTPPSAFEQSLIDYIRAEKAELGI